MKQPLKIAIVVGTFPVVSQTFIVNQINTLIDSGHRVSLYAYKKGEIDSLHESLKKHDLLKEVIYLRKNTPKNLLRFFEFFVWTFKNLFKIRWRRYFKTINVFKYGKKAYLLSHFFAIKWSLIQDDFDIIHIHFAHNARLISYLKSVELFSSKTKLVTTLHGYDLVPSKSEFYKDAYSIVFEQTNMITVNSLYLKKQLQILQPQLNTINVLPVGLDTTFFSKTQPKIRSNFFDIVFCGRLIELKGPEIAIDIVDVLLKKGHTKIRLHMIGDGPLYKHLDEIIKDRSLQNHVFLKGAQTQEIIKKELEEADVLIMPGIPDPKSGQEEAQGLVIQEAQAMELPVVVSDVGGMKYGLIPDESGFVVKANDINAFVDALELLILDETLGLQMGKKGMQFVKEKFDNIVLTQRLLELYNQAIKTI
ncbi:hypothetical protein A9Q86_05105 [Flavobacteriales bacterium 33_180_T64]|nr:hypothetical protein A9Q86_05105 [Flavobacteriales bacterium 33_180_T64]